MAARVTSTHRHVPLLVGPAWCLTALSAVSFPIRSSTAVSLVLLLLPPLPPFAWSGFLPLLLLPPLPPFPWATPTADARRCLLSYTSPSCHFMLNGLFLPVDIQHTLCPCRIFNPREIHALFSPLLFFPSPLLFDVIFYLLPIIHSSSSRNSDRIESIECVHHTHATTYCCTAVRERSEQQ